MIYFPCRRLIAHILLFGQLLSSCQGPSLYRLRARKYSNNSHSIKRDQLFIPPVPITYVAKGGHKVSFKQESDKWHADVEENLPKGFTKKLENLPVRCQESYSIET
ncbi:hypothetical protein [Cardinium endosymbiont of Culicoides punctatus]|uniref:hypothetical protein n=1 Tax=Cardinium endosymbiont of Culicoides punctatus TaxID=2304601 RepID=UPI001058A0A6|nr:hypothetical protein [Cardinium endosymbiont of Culicoides punctatus]TDG95476.1 hypothetical protein CCPUN_03770 [Cardinium endosymbiont of Culicoides punctatus]